MEITRQADYYGLPERTSQELPPPEKVADLLASPTPWQRPLEAHIHEPEWMKDKGGISVSDKPLEAPRPSWDDDDNDDPNARNWGPM